MELSLNKMGTTEETWADSDLAFFGDDLGHWLLRQERMNILVTQQGRKGDLFSCGAQYIIQTLSWSGPSTQL